jgi:hypothetical protein
MELAMKKYLLSRKIQKLFLPIAFVCLLPLWFLLVRNSSHIPAAVYALGGIAALSFILDRFFKPWETERAESRAEKVRLSAQEKPIAADDEGQAEKSASSR